jgi:hypothetical protein
VTVFIDISAGVAGFTVWAVAARGGSDFNDPYTDLSAHAAQ